MALHLASRSSRITDAQIVQEDAERDGSYVRLPRAGAMPARCIACNEPATHVPMRQKPVYRPLVIGIAVIVMALFGALAPDPEWLLPIVAVAAFLGWFCSERYRVPVGICARHTLRRQIPMYVLLVAGSIWAVCGGIAAGAMFAGQWKDSMNEFALAFGAITLLLFVGCAVLWFATGVPRLSVAKADSHYLWLGGAGQPFLDSLRVVRPMPVRAPVLRAVPTAARPANERTDADS